MSEPYQLLPPLTADEYAALKADIAENGIRVPVDVDENGAVLDGHHRARIAAELGLECPTRVVAGLSEAGKRDHALVVNVQRRILTREQRRALVASELQQDDSRSDREIGRLLGVDHKTVGAVRRELRGEIPHARLARLLEVQDYAPYLPHPFLARLPLVPVGEFAAIAQSIKQWGLLMPITLNQDRSIIVDGRIRYLACRAVHVEPEYQVLGSHYDEDKTQDYIIAANCLRTFLTPDQRAAIEARYDELMAAAGGGSP